MAIDVLHGPSNVVPVGYRGKSVVTIHYITDFIAPESLPLRHKFARLEIAQSVRRADRVIAVSDALKVDLCRLFDVPDRKIEVIPHGLPPAIERRLGREAPIESAAAERDGVVALLVTNTLPHKNNVGALEALSAAARAVDTHIQAVLVGPSALESQLAHLSPALAPHLALTFTGQLSQDELCSWYERARLVLLLSTEETFGMPALEAMAMGCNIVASDLPALSELCGDVAIYCNPLSVDSMSDAIVSALNEKTSDVRIARGRELARGFSWDRVAEQTVAVYSELGLR